MSDCPLVVIGASAGGVEALRRIFAMLPQSFGGAIGIVLHVPAQAPSVLPAILSRVGPLVARHAGDGDRLERGSVLIGPPDHHLLVGDGQVRLSKGPQENRHRPAIDPLFRSAAAAYGNRAVGLILSGALDDGAAGLAAIKAAGGVAVVQSPGDAAVPDMPRNALEYVPVDYALPASEIPALLMRLVAELESRRPQRRHVVQVDPGSAELVGPAVSDDSNLAPLTCPDCNGNLWEFREGEVLRYRCRVGHTYSLQSLQAAQDDSVERALWAGLRSLEENAVLARRLRKEAEVRGHVHSVQHFNKRVERAEESIRILRNVLERDRVAAEPGEDHEVAATVPESS